MFLVSGLMSISPKKIHMFILAHENNCIVNYIAMGVKRLSQNGMHILKI